MPGQGHCMEYLPGIYLTPLVVVSILVAILASYTALNMAARVAQAGPRAARWWVAGGALAMGTGIWSMHFIGMLAFRLPIALGYDLGITLISWLLAVVVSALALAQLGSRHLGWRRLAASALLFGIGINAMHYVGMLALRVEPGIRWDRGLVAASIIIAISAAFLALWIAFVLRQEGERAWLARAAAAVVMGLAIVGMHYTGMAAAKFPTGSVCMAAQNGLSLNALAVTIAVATFAVLAIALLTAVFEARLDAHAQMIALSEATARERQRLLENERAAREEAERMSRMKDEFLATLSHELRTPLNAVLGWAQLLQIKSKDETVLKAAATIDRNARIQAQLIDDLLDTSRIVAGKIRLEMGLEEPATVLHAALETAQPAAAARHIRLNLYEGPAGPFRVDAGRIQQVMWNLLSNAIKFTPEGGAVQVKLVEAEGHVRITVSDNGIGIAPEFLPHLFERFRQADASTTRKQAGLGIGLSLARQLVEMHGGTLTAASEGVGKGATFTVSLPVLAPQELPRSVSKPPSHSRLRGRMDLAGLRLVIVDDEEDAREVVRQMLAERGAQVHAAASVNEALLLSRSLQPDLIVSDIAMPGRDGFDLVRALRTGEDALAKIPAIALTAFTYAEDRQRATEAGFNLHLPKPVDMDELAAAIRRLLSDRQRAPD